MNDNTQQSLGCNVTATKRPPTMFNTHFTLNVAVNKLESYSYNWQLKPLSMYDII